MDKLWDKGFDEDARIDSFTVGNDRELDLLLAPYDILGTIAHIKMLAKVGLLPGEDLAKLLPELRNMYSAAVEGRFVIEPDVEDVHSQVELNLTRKLGDMGKKVHLRCWLRVFRSIGQNNDHEASGLRRLGLEFGIFANDQGQDGTRRCRSIFIGSRDNWKAGL